MSEQQPSAGDNEEQNPPCPYCGVTLDNESKYAAAEGHDVKYGCNTDGCVATAWTSKGWENEQNPTSMLAGYL